MKKLLLVLLLALVVTGQAKYDIKVIAVGIGGKNPAFNEADFSHIEFFYTPQLISQAEVDGTAKSAISLLGDGVREVFEGEPELLAKWWDKKDLRKYSVVFDKNGVGTWQGYLNLDDELIESKGKGEEKSLEDTFEFLLEDKNEMDFDENKEFNYKDSDCLIERKMVDFNIESVSGEVKSIKQLIENGKPTMLVFFQIAKDVDLDAGKSKEKDNSIGGFFKSVTKSMAGENWMDMFKKIESEFFNNDVEIEHYK